MAESLYATSDLTSTFTNGTNAIGNTPTTWAGDLNTNTSVTGRWRMTAASGPLGGTQTVDVWCRKGSNSGTPTVALNLYENGSLVQSIVGGTNVTSTTGQAVSGTFDGSVISDSSLVEIEVVMTAAGGSPGTRNSAQVAYLLLTASVATTRTGTGSGTGSSSATGLVTPVKSRTGTGSGAGGSTSVYEIQAGKQRTGTGSGAGAGSATGVVVVSRTGTGSGAGGAVAVRLVTSPRTGTGSGAGAGSASGSRLVQVSASATGVGGSVATGSRLVQVTASGAATSSASSFGYGSARPIPHLTFSVAFTGGPGFYGNSVHAARTGSGSGVGGSTATGAAVTAEQRTGSGSGVGGSSSVGVFFTTESRTASSAGSSGSTASGAIAVTRSGSSTGTGGSSAARVVVVLRSASAAGAGDSVADGSSWSGRSASGSGAGGSSTVWGFLLSSTGTGSGVSTGTSGWEKSFMFRPPADDDFAWASYRNQSQSHRLFSYAAPGSRARNVYKLADGSFVNVDPMDGTVVATYLGGHSIPVTAAEKADLIAAGYEVT